MKVSEIRREEEEAHSSCYIVAAIEANHRGDPSLARELIDAAREAGANAVRFVKRTPEEAGVRSLLDRRAGPGTTYRDKLRAEDLDVKILRELRDYAKPGLQFVLTPYDLSATGAVDAIKPDLLHVASSSIGNLPLLTGLAGRRIPTHIGTAGADSSEIRAAMRLFAGIPLVLLSTVPGIAAVGQLSNLWNFRWLRRFGCATGYADSLPGNESARLAIAAGASVVEKRLALSRSTSGGGAGSGVLPEELAELVRFARMIEDENAEENYDLRVLAELDGLDDERVSLVLARDVPAGTVLESGMIAVKPPMGGLSPRLLDSIIGKRVLYDLRADDMITFGVIE